MIELYSQKASVEVGLSVKKVYKWGYDRKHINRREIPLPRFESTPNYLLSEKYEDRFSISAKHDTQKDSQISDYNQMVAEIIFLLPNENKENTASFNRSNFNTELQEVILKNFEPVTNNYKDFGNLDPNQIERNAIIKDDSFQFQNLKDNLRKETKEIKLQNESEAGKLTKMNSENFDEFLLNSSIDENMLKIEDHLSYHKNFELFDNGSLRWSIEDQNQQIRQSSSPLTQHFDYGNYEQELFYEYDEFADIDDQYFLRTKT